MAGFNQTDLISDFNINSLTFFLFSLSSIVFVRLTQGYRVQSYTLFLLNAFFMALVCSTLKEILFVFGMLITLYTMGTLDERIQNKKGVYQLYAVIGLWTFLFLCKDPQLFSHFNPFSFISIKVIGLSYLIFRGISYLFEKEFVPHKKNFIHFVNYMLFFPTIVSGPIERFSHFSKTRDVKSPPSLDIIVQSIQRILNGMIKKFVLADNLMSFGIFSLSENPDASVFMLWVGSFIMLFLIYLDFSGYCDMMLGIARLMGFELIENFNAPFISKNIQEFWTRWHISLGSIIQDYIFTPLNKHVVTHLKKKWHFCFMIFIYLFSMILVAMWHGTTLGFLVFGTVHGTALVLFQIKRKFFKKHAIHPSSTTSKMSLYTWRLLTYSFISFSLILWYGSFSMAIQTYKKLLGFI